MMNIKVLHGQNIPVSWRRYQEILKSARNKGFKTLTLAEESQGNSLFEEKILFTLENPKILALPKSIKNLIIWNEGDLPVSFLKKLPGSTQVEKFDIPKTIFKFLDSLGTQNTKNSLFLLHQLLKKESPEFVFILLARHLRDLYWAKISPENLPYPAWRKNKLENQAERFSKEGLEKKINFLAQADVQSKSGGKSLDFWLDLALIDRLE
jgi:hypothetical protein